ncbi:MAG: hypothetical protein GF411_05175 [Candidatus Lokiarchaeota archaeon]|nr:hypothetical protein [Candidatus Lokiarchaeota archaeon]
MLLLRGNRAVSNASPLIHLARVVRLHLLRNLYQEILIPDKVFRETCVIQKSPDSVIIQVPIGEGWRLVRPMKNSTIDILSASAGIDPGEAAAILLTKEKRLLLLIDDKMGRTAAKIFGIPCLSAIGIHIQVLTRRIFV